MLIVILPITCCGPTPIHQTPIHQSSKEAMAFSTENENPFRHYEPNNKQTSVFIKRFFGQWSYNDIAVAHDISVDAARKLYYAGAKKTACRHH